MTTLLIIVIVLAMVFDFLNGIHGSSNIVATMIASRAFSPRAALAITALAEFSGPLIFGVAVANTIGNEIAESSAITLSVLLAALASAILWNLLTLYLGLPSSSSHALIGGFVGAVAMGAEGGAIYMSGVTKVLVAMFISPLIGFAFGYAINKLVYVLCRRASPRVNWFFKRGQIVTAVALALSHGTNDAQKSMGIVTLALVSSGLLSEFRVPVWVIVLCAGMIALGTALGGWRLIRTLGGKFYKIRPVDGYNSQLASAVVILGSSILGGPVSTTQVVSTSIMGVGASHRFSKVRWGVAVDIMVAWLLTIPASGLMASGFYLLLRGLM